jgi:hypothetical protein
MAIAFHYTSLRRYLHRMPSSSPALRECSVVDDNEDTQERYGGSRALMGVASDNLRAVGAGSSVRTGIFRLVVCRTRAIRNGLGSLSLGKSMPIEVASVITIHGLMYVDDCVMAFKDGFPMKCWMVHSSKGSTEVS